MTEVAGRVALIQQDNLIDVHNMIELNRVRLLEMEWVDGYDLQRLLSTWISGACDSWDTESTRAHFSSSAA